MTVAIILGLILIMVVCGILCTMQEKLLNLIVQFCDLVIIDDCVMRQGDNKMLKLIVVFRIKTFVVLWYCLKTLRLILSRLSSLLGLGLDICLRSSLCVCGMLSWSSLSSLNFLQSWITPFGPAETTETININYNL